VAVLVTGGCGLSGSFAVRHAAELGIPVVAYDIAQKTELLQDVLDRVQLVKGGHHERPGTHTSRSGVWGGTDPTSGELPDGSSIRTPLREQFGYVPEYDVKRGSREYIAFLKTGNYKQLP